MQCCFGHDRSIAVGHLKKRSRNEHVSLQAADFLFGAAAQPHDFLHEPLFRILSSGLLGAAITSLALRVCPLPLHQFPLPLSATLIKM